MPIDDRDPQMPEGWFKRYPAPMLEAMCRQHINTKVNHTTPLYGPLLYTLARVVGAHNAIEIGVAYGWASGFIAHAVKDNNTRYESKGKYVGLDIADESVLQAEFDRLQLPGQFIQTESVKWLETQKMFGPGDVNFIFNDGWHNTEYVLREIELLYPLLAGNGDGYLVMHDIYAWCEEVYERILKDPRYQWEAIRFLPNYGLAILRKMDGYDHSKRFWPEGDQKAEAGFVT